MPPADFSVTQQRCTQSGTSLQHRMSGHGQMRIDCNWRTTVAINSLAGLLRGTVGYCWKPGGGRGSGEGTHVRHVALLSLHSSPQRETRQDVFIS